MRVIKHFFYRSSLIFKIQVTWILIYTFFFSGITLIAQDTGWKANPEIIQERQDSRPDYVWLESFVKDYDLSDPLITESGELVNTPGQWQSRRQELLNIFRSQMYGYRPEEPDRVCFHLVEKDNEAIEGNASMKRISIVSRYEDRTHQFELILFLPNQIKNKVPVFLFMNNRSPENTDPTRENVSEFWPVEMVIKRGYGIAAIQNDELAPDNAEDFYKGVIRLFEGSSAETSRAPDAWGAVAAWGWGASRVMDYFEINSRVDESRVALLGHSRGGKASLWAGAEDERFSLVISNQSGAGGAALSSRGFGETIEAVNRFEHWFNENFKSFSGREEEMSFDQHMLISLLAPRAVYIGSADEDLWADPRGEFLSLVHASDVYGLWNYQHVGVDQMPALDAPVNFGHRGYHIRSGSHNLNVKDWQYYMDFADSVWPNTTWKSY